MRVNDDSFNAAGKVFSKPWNECNFAGKILMRKVVVMQYDSPVRTDFLMASSVKCICWLYTFYLGVFGAASVLLHTTLDSVLISTSGFVSGKLKGVNFCYCLFFSRVYASHTRINLWASPEGPLVARTAGVCSKGRVRCLLLTVLPQTQSLALKVQSLCFIWGDGKCIG